MMMSSACCQVGGVRVECGEVMGDAPVGTSSPKHRQTTRRGETQQKSRKKRGEGRRKGNRRGRQEERRSKRRGQEERKRGEER